MGQIDTVEALAVLKEAAKDAGSIISQSFGATSVRAKKNVYDLVSDADYNAEVAVRERMKQWKEEICFIGEEEVSAQSGGSLPPLTDALTIILDPLDGTSNYVSGYESVCVSIALLLNKELLVSIVHKPIGTVETFTAIKGEGAFLNGTRIAVSSVGTVQEALVGTELGTKRDKETVDAVFARLRQLMVARSIRCRGSCALQICDVAAGRLAAFYEIGFGGPWDVAGAALVLQEAGGELTDPQKGPFDLTSRRVLATNGIVTSELQQLLAQAPTASTEP